MERSRRSVNPQVSGTGTVNLAGPANGDDPSALGDVKITLSFAVTADGDISIRIDGSGTDEVTHTFVLALTPISSGELGLPPQSEVSPLPGQLTYGVWTTGAGLLLAFRDGSC
jgi:hypothetical protein